MRHRPEGIGEKNGSSENQVLNDTAKIRRRLGVDAAKVRFGANLTSPSGYALANVPTPHGAERRHEEAHGTKVRKPRHGKDCSKWHSEQIRPTAQRARRSCRHEMGIIEASALGTLANRRKCAKAVLANRA
jgi:hypothetical protein